jgi:hypothetical protein
MLPAQSSAAWAVVITVGGVIGSGAVATALGWLAQLVLGAV